ncbi:MAG: hypothetical protein U5K54_02650 [Cytophagales bacterium]|nr:hypothetical protein [Cytophagales bacterium]
MKNLLNYLTAMLLVMLLAPVSYLLTPLLTRRVLPVTPSSESAKTGSHGKSPA